MAIYKSSVLLQRRYLGLRVNVHWLSPFTRNKHVHIILESARWHLIKLSWAKKWAFSVQCWCC